MGMTPLELHRRLLYCRRAEELTATLYRQQEMRVPVHLGIGQEAIAVGVCAALNLPHDVVFASHRCHNHYLSCGGSAEALFAELYGRETGCSRGRGAHGHLTSREHGFIASSPILGQMIAVATGSALAFKLDGSQNVAVTFFGDAAMEEGIAYEAMNYASLMKLPVLFVCENNGLSTEATFDKRFPEGTELCDRAVVFRVGAMQADGNDVEDIYATTAQALDHVRRGQPMFLEMKTYRWLEHVGPNYDHEVGRTHRTESELREWQERDPLKISETRLIEDLEIPRSALEKMDAEIQAELAQAAERARNAPEPSKDTLFENVY